MKKNLFIILSMMIIALVATSCVNYEVKIKKIDGTKLAYFSAQDSQTKSDLWGVQETIADNTRIVIEAKYKNISKHGNFFALQTNDGLQLFDLSGKLLVKDFFTKVALFNEPVEYFELLAANTKTVYLVKEKQTLGPWSEYLLSKEGICYKDTGGLGLLTLQTTPILPAEYKEITFLTETKKVRGKEVSTPYILAQDAKKDWYLYAKDGKMLKKIPGWNLKKYTKDSKQTELEGVFKGTVPAI